MDERQRFPLRNRFVSKLLEGVRMSAQEIVLFESKDGAVKKGQVQVL